MPEEDSLIEKLTELTGKLDKKALAGAVGLMCLSWGALIPVYFLLRKWKENNKRWGDLKEVEARHLSLLEKDKAKE